MAEVTLVMMREFEARLEARFQVLEKGIREQAEAGAAAAMAATDSAVSKKLEEADLAFKEEQARVDAKVDAMGTSMSQISGEGLQALLVKIQQQLLTVHVKNSNKKMLIILLLILQADCKLKKI